MSTAPKLNPFTGQLQLLSDYAGDIAGLQESLDTVTDNLIVTDWRLQVAYSLSVLKFKDSFTDEFIDQSGIDLGQCINQIYSDQSYASFPLDEYDDDTKLMLHCNGANNSIIFTDEIGNTVTAYGGAKLSDTLPKFGTASGSFNGTSSYLSTPYSSDFNLGTDDFTIDFWVKFSAANAQIIFDQSVSGADRWGLYFDINSDFNIFYNEAHAAWVQFYVAGLITVGTWHHVAVVRYSSQLAIYIDGNLIQTSAYNVTINTSAPFEIGRTSIGGGFYFNGYIDEFRISKGIARWTEDFTPWAIEYGVRPEVADNMTLVSNEVEATSQPTSARIVALIEAFYPYTINTDLKFYVSEDDGAHYDQVTMSDEGYIDGAKTVLAGTVNLTSYSDKTMRYKIETLNNKPIAIHAMSLLWK
jgi:hypothetical protein